MSWTQGIQMREDLPPKFRLWADTLGKGEIQCMVWDDTEPNILYLDYGEKGSFSLDVTGTPLAR